jgi:WD40 repeat protein
MSVLAHRCRQPALVRRGRGRSGIAATFIACGALLCACNEETDPTDDGSDSQGDEPATCLHTAAAIDGPGTYAYTVDWSPIDDYVLAGTDQDVRLLRADTAAEELVLVDSIMVRPRSNVIRWSADGLHALSTGLEVQLFAVSRDPPELIHLASYTGHEGDIYGLGWHPDGAHALTGGRDGTVRLLAVDTAAGTLVEQAIFYGHVGKVLGLHWAPDGRHAITVGTDGTVRLLAIDVEADPPIIDQLELKIDPDEENAVSWAAGGDPVMTGTWAERHVVQIWSVDVDAATFTLMSEFAGHPSGVTVLEWSRDRERIATAGHDDTVVLSRYADGHLTAIAELDGHDTGVHAVSWSPDEDHMAVASSTIDRVSLVNAADCPRSAAQ